MKCDYCNQLVLLLTTAKSSINFHENIPTRLTTQQRLSVSSLLVSVYHTRGWKTWRIQFRWNSWSSDMRDDSLKLASLALICSSLSGLKVLVYLRDVQHDALPVRPVRPHQLLHVLFVTEQQFRKPGHFCRVWNLLNRRRRTSNIILHIKIPNSKTLNQLSIRDN